MNHHRFLGVSSQVPDAAILEVEIVVSFIDKVANRKGGNLRGCRKAFGQQGDKNQPVHTRQQIKVRCLQIRE